MEPCTSCDRTRYLYITPCKVCNQKVCNKCQVIMAIKEFEHGRYCWDCIRAMETANNIKLW